MARAATLEPMGAVDLRTAEWRAADASHLRGTCLPVRKSQVRWQEPSAEFEPVVNLGCGKLWLLPEGNNHEEHWAGNSGVLDDGPFTFRKLSEGQRCEIELT